MRRCTVHLEVIYDETTEGSPRKWDWPMLTDNENVTYLAICDDEPYTVEEV